MFRDWPRTLRRASYKGVGFYVERDTIETGRRLVVHEFPLKDVPYIEDLGRDANKINVTAYVISDNADAEEKQLRSACERGGAGTLVLPMQALQAHCQSCSRDFAKDKLGFVAFSLKFVREGTGEVQFPAGYLGNLVGQASTSLLAALSLRFTASFSTANAASFVVEAAVGEIRAAASLLDVVARSLPLDTGLAPPIYDVIAGIHDNAETLAASGLEPDTVTRTRFVAARPSETSDAFVVQVADALEQMRLAVDPTTTMRELAPLLSFEPDGPIPLPTTPSQARIAANARAVAEAVRMAARVAYARAAAARIYADRREAIQARADAAELFAAEIEAAGEGGRYHAWTELMDLSGRLAEYLTRRIADLAPVIGVETAQSMPSLWWSNRLYGTADRAGELVARNRVIHGSFMPSTFEALAR